VAAIGATLVALYVVMAPGWNATSCQGSVTDGSNSSAEVVIERPARNTVLGPKRPIASAMRGSRKAPRAFHVLTRAYPAL